MMPNDESLYGQWPKCGEIDIMEVLGHEPEKAYGTIHYGEPHAEQQGTYTLENGTFADDYHTYSVLSGSLKTTFFSGFLTFSS